MTIATLQCGLIAPLDHHLRPRTAYPSGHRSMRVSMFVASELATSGSVIEKQERILPSSSRGSQRSLTVV